MLNQKIRSVAMNLSRSEIENFINEWCLSERDRKILYRRWIDGIKLEPLSEEFDMSVRQIKYIVKKYQILIDSKLP